MYFGLLIFDRRWLGRSAAVAFMDDASIKNRKSQMQNLPGRQFDAECRPLALVTFHADLAAHQVDIALYDGQAQPVMQTLGIPGKVGPVKAHEKMFPGQRRDAAAGDLDHDQPSASRYR